MPIESRSGHSLALRRGGRLLESVDSQKTLNRALENLIGSGARCSIAYETISEGTAESFLLLCPKQGVPGEVLVHIKDSLQEWLKKKPTAPATMRPIGDYTMYSIQKPKNSNGKFTPISIEQLLSAPKANDRKTGLVGMPSLMAACGLGLVHIISPPKHCVEHICRVISVAAHGAVTSNNLQDPSHLLLSNIAVFLVVDGSLFFLCMVVDELTNSHN